MPNLEGQVLKGRYRIEELLGRGGMAEVYKAWDNRRRYHVAVKILREDLAEDREFDRRFRREAEALARLSHRNIVRFYSFERDGYLAFIVMDYVEGTNLRRRIFDADGPLPAAEILSITDQVVAALAYAHSQGVLHRDVKPGNIMLQPDPRAGPGGLAQMADFGIARAADAATMTTVMPGTPAYMSPEQCRSEPLDVRTDVYSLGIVVYEMLAGRRPFVGDTEATTGSTRERIRWEQMHAEPLPLRQLNPELPGGVEAVVRKALAKEPEDRWPGVLAFWQGLEVAVGSGVAKAVEPHPPPFPVEAPAEVPRSTPASPSGPEPEPETPCPTLPVGAAASYQPQVRAGLPPWAWVVGGVLLAALVITAVALLSRGSTESLPTATPSVIVVAEVTTSMTQAPTAAWAITDALVPSSIPIVTPLPTELPSLQPPIPVGTIHGFDDYLVGIDFSPDSSNLAVLSILADTMGSSRIELWDLAREEPTEVLHSGSALYEVAFSPDGDEVVAWPWFFGEAITETIQVFDLNSDRRTLRMDHLGVALDAAFSSDGSLLAVASIGPEGYPWEVDLWDTDSGNQTGRLVPSQMPSSLAFDPLGGRLAIATVGDWRGRSIQVELWDLAAQQETDFDFWSIDVATSVGLVQLFWPEPGSTLVLAAVEGPFEDTSQVTIHTWNLDSRSEAWRVDLPTTTQQWDLEWLQAAASLDGRILAVCVPDRGADGALYFVDLVAGREMGKNWHIAGNYLTVALSGDGGLVATVPFDPEVEDSQWTLDLWAITGE